jgi:hypothetical protein
MKHQSGCQAISGNGLNQSQKQAMKNIGARNCGKYEKIKQKQINYNGIICVGNFRDLLFFSRQIDIRTIHLQYLFMG